MTPDLQPAPVKAWCWNKRHDIRVAQEPPAMAYVFWCATCTYDPAVHKDDIERIEHLGLA
jgi:hypothetical protein